MKFIRGVFTICFAVSVLILFSGCGSDDYDLEDDPLDYAGTWFGQRSPAGFTVINVVYVGTKGGTFYYAVGMNEYSILKSDENPKNVTLYWDMQEFSDEIWGDSSELVSHNTISMLLGRLSLKHDGDFLSVSIEGEKENCKFQRVNSSRDLSKKAGELEKKINDMAQQGFQKKYPNAKIVIKNEADLSAAENLERMLKREAPKAKKLL